MTSVCLQQQQQTKKKGMKNNLECPDYIFQQVYQLYMLDALKIVHAFSFIINNFYFTFKV